MKKKSIRDKRERKANTEDKLQYLISDNKFVKNDKIQHMHWWKIEDGEGGKDRWGYGRRGEFFWLEDNELSDQNAHS